MGRNNEPPPRRVNGFSPPYSKAQISAWVALVATFFQFILCITPVLPLAASIPVTAFFVSIILGVCYYGGLTQSLNPIDVHLAHHLQTVNNNAENGISPSLPQEEMKHCWICDIEVAEHSMHCKFCNKCVYHFDHHCMWLNTCVGSANYKYFFRTMFLIFAMELSHFVIQIVLLVHSFTGGSTNDRVQNWLGGSEVAMHAAWIFFAIFNTVSLVLIGQLIWFHIGLQRENLTTYQYIVRDSRKKRELTRLQEDLEAQRITAIAKAYREKKTLQAWKLRIGGSCRSVGCTLCDPLDLPEPANPDAGFASALGGTNRSSSPPPAAASETSEAREEGPPQGQAEGDGEQATDLNIGA